MAHNFELKEPIATVDGVLEYGQRLASNEGLDFMLEHPEFCVYYPYNVGDGYENGARAEAAVGELWRLFGDATIENTSIDAVQIDGSAAVGLADAFAHGVKKVRTDKSRTYTKTEPKDSDIDLDIYFTDRDGQEPILETISGLFYTHANNLSASIGKVSIHGLPTQAVRDQMRQRTSDHIVNHTILSRHYPAIYDPRGVYKDVVNEARLLVAQSETARVACMENAAERFIDVNLELLVKTGKVEHINAPYSKWPAHGSGINIPNRTSSKDGVVHCSERKFVEIVNGRAATAE